MHIVQKAISHGLAHSAELQAVCSENEMLNFRQGSGDNCTCTHVHTICPLGKATDTRHNGHG